jgi:putative toxin-antitoxin system antitoxin component (TIGR02293 family)
MATAAAPRRRAPTRPSLLGLGLPVANPLELHAALRAGLPGSAIAALKAATGLPDAEIAELLQVSERTFTRLKASRARRLAPDLSDRVYAVAALYALADEVLGDHATALQWMNAPQFGLAEAVPRALLSTEPGRQQVRALLQRIEHGFLA